MRRYADLFKKNVINFKLKLCCFMAPVRTGLLTFTLMNIAIGYITLMFFVEGSFEPLLLTTLKGISSSPPNYGPSCLIVYAVELGSNVLLLSGMIRNDLALLRAYLYFALGVLMAAVMTYTVMFSPQAPLVKFLILASIGYQIYMILLVRSAMIEIKQNSVNNDYSYKVNYRQSSIRYSRPGSRDNYTVVIEPYGYNRPRRSLVPAITDTRRNIKPTITKELSKEEPVKEATVTTPPANSKGESEKGVAKEDKEESAKEVKKKEVKRRRSIFGTKEKVKKDESPATNS